MLLGRACRLLLVAASSLRKMLDNVVRDLRSADGRDEPASLDEGVVEGCRRRESLLVLPERIGGRRLGCPRRKPPSSALSLGEGES